MSSESLLRSLLSFLFFSVRLQEPAPTNRDVAFDFGKKMKVYPFFVLCIPICVFYFPFNFWYLHQCATIINLRGDKGVNVKQNVL
jgi:hypothetical protein